MIAEDIKILNGENEFQNAEFEKNDKIIDYETSKNLSYSDIISITKGLGIISEFYDVNAVASTTPVGICAVSLGTNIEDVVVNVMDSNPIDFMKSTITSSREINSDVVKMFKDTNIIVILKYLEVDGISIHSITVTTKYISNINLLIFFFLI